jgi:hypothetical protein
VGLVAERQDRPPIRPQVPVKPGERAGFRPDTAPRLGLHCSHMW